MKPFHKRLNKRKASKLTLKTHRKHAHPDLQDTLKKDASDASPIRSEDIKFHQHY